MTGSVKEIQRELRALSDPNKARFFQKFFKTGPGQYGEKDLFLGLNVPQIRSLARKHKDLPIPEILKFLKSKYHEERLFSLVILSSRFSKGSENLRKLIFNLYWKHRRQVNNWDLVDTSAPQIVGAYLLEKDRKRLYQLAKSKSLWDRRIAIVATHHFIRKGDLKETFALSSLLLKDQEDLMHKAVGWMLREAGKRDLKQLRKFLQKHAAEMPRTMLRYSIEKMEPKERQKFMRPKSAS